MAGLSGSRGESASLDSSPGLFHGERSRHRMLCMARGLIDDDVSRILDSHATQMQCQRSEDASGDL